MAYKRVTKEELEDYLSRNPGGSYRVNGQEAQAAFGDEDQGALMKILTGLSRPFRAVPASVAAAISGKEDYDNPFLTAREEASFKEDPTKWGTKQAAGLASYLIPGGSQAASVGGRIAGAAAKGAGAGALGGFSASSDDDELESILKGAGLGGVIGGGIQAGGEAFKALKAAGLDKKLKQASDDLKVTAIKKKVGVAPTTKQGKYGLIKDVADTADDFNMTIKGPEDVSKLSSEIFNKYGNLADEYAKVFDDAGNVIDVNIIKQPLIKKLSSTKTPELQEPIKRVLSSIDEVTQGSSSMGAKDLLSLRREWGSLGNWNQFTPTNERMVAAIWEDAYGVANDVLEESLKKAGYNQFRKVNNLLKTGIEAQNWAQRAEAFRRGSPVWNDMTQDALAIGAAGLGGGVGGAAGVVGSKFLQANAEDIASKGLGGLSEILRGAGSVAQGVGNVAGGAGRVAQRIGPAMAGQAVGQSDQTQSQPQQTQPVYNQGGLAQDELQALNFYLADAILQGQISSSDANAVMGLLGLDGESGGASTEGQRDYQLAAEALQDAYQYIDQGAGKLSTLGGNIARFFGSPTGSSEYRAKLDTATAFLRKALIGSGQSEAELKNLNLPKPTDEPAIAKQKIEALIPLLRARAGVQSY